MKDDNINRIEMEAEEYAAYFKEDLDALEEELKKSQNYSKIIDEEIKRLSEPGLSTRNNQHYLIEHITNAVQLQTQRQSLRKDRVAIKKLILDYTNKQLERNIKETANGDSSAALMEKLKEFLEKDKDIKNSKKVMPQQENLDSEIDSILEATDKDGD